MFTQYVETPLGLLLLRADGTALREVILAGQRGPETPNDVTALAAAQLSEYFLKKRESFSVPLAPQGTPFQKSVWAALALIPYGRVVTYGQLAAACGRPSAVRAAASAVGKNPLAVFLPCHRVVAAQGMGGFAWGLAAKRTLLHLEGVVIPKNSPVSQNFLFTFP